MYIYGYFQNEETPKVSLSAVKYLSEQLEKFLLIYEKEVLIDDEEDRKRIEQLKNISMLLKQGRYHELIVDPYSVIDFQNDDDDYIPKYAPI